MKTKVVRSVKENVFQNQLISETIACFAEMVQVYTDEMATTLKANPIVVHPIHQMILKFQVRLEGIPKITVIP